MCKCLSSVHNFFIITNIIIKEVAVPIKHIHSFILVVITETQLFYENLSIKMLMNGTEPETSIALSDTIDSCI